MARAVIGNPFANQIPTVSATAQPIDIYSQAVLKKGPLESLSALLTSLETKATPALKNAEERQAKAAYAEGVELYNKTRVSIGDAVRDGVIAEGDSPYLRKGYRISHLNAMSARYTQELNDALEIKKLYKNGNPDSIDEFTTQFYETFQTENGFTGHSDVEIAEYFSTTASKANEAFRASWADKNRDWQKDQNYDAWSNETSTYILTMYNEEDTEDERAKKEASFTTWVNGRIKQAEVDGMDRDKVNETILNSVILSAYQSNDLTILDSLDEIITGTGALGTNLKAAEAMFTAKSNIAENIAKAEKDQTAAKLVADNQTVSTLETEASALISATADTPSADKILYLNRRIDEALNDIRILGNNGNAKAASLYRSMVKFRQAQLKKGTEFRGDEDKVHALMMKELSKYDNIGDVYNFLTTQMNTGVIKKGQETSLLSQWKTVYGDIDEIGLDWLKPNSSAKEAKSALLTAVGSAGSFADTGEIGEARRRAGNLFDQTYQILKRGWLEANPNKQYNHVVEYNIAAEAADIVAKRNISSSVRTQVNENFETIRAENNEAEALATAEGKPIVTRTTTNIINAIGGE